MTARLDVSVGARLFPFRTFRSPSGRSVLVREPPLVHHEDFLYPSTQGRVSDQQCILMIIGLAADGGREARMGISVPSPWETVQLGSGLPRVRERRRLPHCQAIMGKGVSLSSPLDILDAYALFLPLVHGSLARAGKVKSQTPKVEPQEKKKVPKGRAKKRILYNRRCVLLVAPTSIRLNSVL